MGAGGTADATEGLELALERMLRHHGVRRRGRFHLMGLEEVSRRLGPKWPKLGERVHAIADSVIRRRLAADDLFIRIDDLHYAIVFDSRVTEAQASVKLALIAQEVGQHLLGSAPLAYDILTLRTASLSDEGKVSLGNRDNGETEEHADKPAATAFRPWEWREGLQFIFRPMWFVRSKVISTYVCLPVLATAGGRYLSGYGVLPQPDNADNILELDLALVERIAEELGTLASRDLRSLLSLPVHFETLAGQRQRQIYLQHCLHRLRDGGKRLVFEIVGLPVGIPQSRIQKLIEVIKPFSRSVIARFDIAHNRFDDYHSAGLYAVGADIYSESRPESFIMEKMNLFVGEAARQGLRTYIHGVRSISLSTAAICAGFDYVDGYAITSVAEGANDVLVYDIRAPYDKKMSLGT